jgi:hypothetical protein
MKKIIYRVWVYDKEDKEILNQELWREDYQGFLGHLNKNIPEWSYMLIKKPKPKGDRT